MSGNHALIFGMFLNKNLPGQVLMLSQAQVALRDGQSRMH